MHLNCRAIDLLASFDWKVRRIGRGGLVALPDAGIVEKL
jgi:hypothetical protein